MRHTSISKLLAIAASATLTALAPVAAQDRVLSGPDRAYFDARYSPDGNWLSYQADGSLRVATSAGANESIAYTSGRGVSYLWESGSQTLLVTTGDRLFRVTRDGRSQRQVSNLTGKSVLDLWGIAGNYVICTRRQSTSNYVARIDLTNGKIEDIVTGVPGVTSVQIDPGGTTMVLSNTVFLFQYNFYRAGVDGKGLSVITGTPLTALARNARWLEGTKSCVIEYVGTLGNLGGGWQLWRMDASNGNLSPLTWQPRFRRGVPAVSPDGKWIASYELMKSGETRAVIVPALGGGEIIASPALNNSDGKIAWAPDNKTLIYTGTTNAKRKGDLRSFSLERALRLSPGPRPGTTRRWSFELTTGDVGLVFFGLAAAMPLQIPGLTGNFGLDLAALPPLVLASGVDKDIAGVFTTPNSQSLIGAEVALQGLRLEAGKGLKGAWADLVRVTILP